jgi:hypothetical protein
MFIWTFLFWCEQLILEVCPSILDTPCIYGLYFAPAHAPSCFPGTSTWVSPTRREALPARTHCRRNEGVSLDLRQQPVPCSGLPLEESRNGRNCPQWPQRRTSAYCHVPDRSSSHFYTQCPYVHFNIMLPPTPSAPKRPFHRRLVLPRGPFTDIWFSHMALSLTPSSPTWPFHRRLVLPRDPFTDA